jgi:hypothetical protein
LNLQPNIVQLPGSLYLHQHKSAEINKIKVVKLIKLCKTFKKLMLIKGIYSDKVRNLH